MYKGNSISVIIAAAGKGTRLGGDIPKQYLMIGSKPVLAKTLKVFSDMDEIDHIFIVANEEYIKHCRNIVGSYEINKVRDIVRGGCERQESVYNALKAIGEKCPDTDYVLVHDGARPFISERIINEGIKFAEIYGAAAPGVMPKDTIKVKNEKNFSVDTPNRANLVSIQTPQVFKFDEILECHEKIRYNGEKVTDDTMVVEKYGYSVYLYDGEYTNIKVTTPEDLILAERLI